MINVTVDYQYRREVDHDQSIVRANIQLIDWSDVFDTLSSFYELMDDAGYRVLRVDVQEVKMDEHRDQI